MIEIPPTEATLGFSSPVFFERTSKIRERIVDCSREELIDYSFYNLNMLERFQGACQKINEELEQNLGYNETIRIPSSRPDLPN